MTNRACPLAVLRRMSLAVRSAIMGALSTGIVTTKLAEHRGGSDGVSQQGTVGAEDISDE